MGVASPRSSSLEGDPFLLRRQLIQGVGSIPSIPRPGKLRNANFNNPAVIRCQCRRQNSALVDFHNI